MGRLSIYEFNPDDAERFAHSIGAKARVKNGQLEFMYCPYCQGGKNREKNKFAISLRTGQFECKRASCGMKGNMITLSRDFSDKFELSSDVTRYYNVNDYNSRFKKFKEAHRKIESKDRAVEYLQSKGISEEICRKYELTIKEGTDNVLVFPFKNEEGNLTFVKYRNIEYIKGQGNKEWCEPNCMPILFGMNHCSDSGTLVITEGQMDSLSVAEAGIENAVSVPTGANGFTWVPHCWNWLQRFDRIIVFGDYEKGKVTLSEDLLKRFPKKIFTVRKEDYLECKDANELLLKHGKKAIVQAVNNAEPQRSRLLKRMTEVQMVDIEKTESIKTGFDNVDKMLSGGFHLGQLIILTGKRGDGKSTLMSQFIVDALSQTNDKGEYLYNCMVYSGELVDFYFKAWIDRQIFGKNNLQQSEVDIINKWYNDRLFLFDNNALADPENNQSEMDAVLEAIEEAVVQMNVKFICLDNLMTAIELDPKTSTYALQSIFVGKLASICKKYNVVIVLVAHPRKDSMGMDENDSISGSADITNKADIVLKYQRTKPENGVDPTTQPPRQLAILKNRLTGRITGGNPIAMYYDEASKRISEKENDFSKDYLKNEHDFVQLTIDDEEEVPF